MIGAVKIAFIASSALSTGTSKLIQGLPSLEWACIDAYTSLSEPSAPACHHEHVADTNVACDLARSPRTLKGLVFECYTLASIKKLSPR